MTDRQTVAISELEGIRATSPESLPILRVVVYDKEGNASKIRAVELQRFLDLGFLAEPPKEVEVVVDPPAPFVPPILHHMVRSFRG